MLIIILYVMDTNSPYLNKAENSLPASPIKQNLIQHQNYVRLPYLIFVISILCISPFYYGFSLTYVSTISSQILIKYFGETAGQPFMVGILIGIVPVGAAFGALSTPLFMKFFSRRNFLLFFNIFAILIAGVIQINYLPVLLICRFIQGFIIGNYMGLVPIYVKQLTPLSLRGSLGALSQFFNIGGVVVCYALALIFYSSNSNPELEWRFMFSFTGILVIIQSVLMMLNYIPESPISLIEKGRLLESKKVLLIFNPEDLVDNVFNDYLKLSKRNNFEIRMKSQKKRPKSFGPIVNNQNAIELKKVFSFKENTQFQTNQINLVINPSFSPISSKEESQKIKTKIADLQKIKHEEGQGHFKISLKAFIVGFQLPLMQQFSGIKTIVTQIGIIIQKYNHQLAVYSPLSINIIQFAATAFSILVLARLGRRIILVYGNLGVSICAFAIGGLFLGIQQTNQKSSVYVALAFIILFMIIYGLTIGPTVWLYVPQIIPAKVVPIATSMNWLGVSVCVIITPIIMDEYGSSYPAFFFFGSISLVFFVINYFLVIETKGLSTSEIAQKLS